MKREEFHEYGEESRVCALRQAQGQELRMEGVAFAGVSDGKP